MFNKIKQQLANINNTKKKKSPLDEISEKGLDIDISNLFKYSSQELHNYIILYEKQSDKFKKHYGDLHDENCQIKEKLQLLETEKNQILTEKQQFKFQVDNICTILTSETKEKEKYKQELELLKAQKINQPSMPVEDNFDVLKSKFENLEALLKDKQAENGQNENFEKVMQEIAALKINISENQEKIKENQKNGPNDENSHNEYKEKYEITVINLDKCEKIKQELESDLGKMSEKLSVLKAENFALSSALNELKAKIKAEESKVSDLSNENKNLTEENELFKGKINSVINEKTKLDEINSSDTRELKNKYEEAKENIAKLEEFIKAQTENFNSKQRDIENKLIQERLKFDQKSRDYAKIEEQYNQAKNDLTSQIEANNKANEKLQVLDMKIINDKKLLKEEKKKIKSLKKEVIDISNKNLVENSAKDEKIKQLETSFAEAQKKVSSLEEERQAYLNHELELKSQEMKFHELQTEHLNLQKLFQELQEKSQTLEEDYNSQKSIIQTLQEKREASLHEIQKLSHENLNLKSMINTNTPKMKSSGVNNSQGFGGSMESSQKMGRHNNKTEEMKNEELSALKKSESSKKEELNTPLQSSLLKKKMEAKFLGMTKKELENLYREMIEVLLPRMNEPELSKAFIKVEKKLNDAIRRAQDHIDSLQDM